MPDDSNRIHAFGPFRLETAAAQLTREGQPVPLPPKVFQLLLTLVENAGRIVDRDELMRQLWPDVSVTPANLTQHVFTLRQILEGDAEGTKYVETIPRRGYRFIADVGTVVEGTPPSPLTPTAQAEIERPLGRRSATMLFWFIGIAIVAGVAAYGSKLRRDAGLAPSGLGSGAPRRAIAVLNMKSLSAAPEDEWLATALSEMLAAEIAAAGTLRTIPGETIARARADLALPSAATLSRETLSRLRSNCGADLVLGGSYLAIAEGDQLRLDFTVQDSLTGETVAIVTRTGSRSDLLQLVSGAGSVLRQSLGLRTTSAATPTAALSVFPADARAARLYAEGLERLRVFDAIGARALLDEAAEIDPNNAIIHSALAEALTALGYQGLAAQSARRAMELCGNQPRDVRLMAEARWLLAENKWDEAVVPYSALWKFFPDDIEHGLRLASAQVSASLEQDAFLTIAALRKLPPPANADPRIDIVEAKAARNASDYPRQLRLARSAASRGAAVSSRLLLAQARMEEGSALGSLGKPDEAMAAYAEAQKIFHASGDRRAEARARISCGILLNQSGRPNEAIELYEQARVTYEQIGDKGGLARAFMNTGVVLQARGDWKAARHQYDQALQMSREVGAEGVTAVALANMAHIDVAAGELEKAAVTYVEAAATLEKLADKPRLAAILESLAIVRLRQGQSRESLTLIERAMRIARETGHKAYTHRVMATHAEILLESGRLVESRKVLERLALEAAESKERGYQATAAAGLADVLYEQNVPDEARKKAVEGRAVYEENQESTSLAELDLLIARLELLAGSARRAEEIAASALKTFVNEDYLNGKIASTALLARSRLAAGDRLTARKHASDAWRLAAGGQNIMLRFQTAAAVGLTGQDEAQAIELLGRSIDDATRCGLVRCRFELTLALAEVEKRTGQTVRAMERAGALATEARNAGFIRIAAIAETHLRT